MAEAKAKREARGLGELAGAGQVEEMRAETNTIGSWGAVVVTDEGRAGGTFARPGIPGPGQVADVMGVGIIVDRIGKGGGAAIFSGLAEHKGVMGGGGIGGELGQITGDGFSKAVVYVHIAGQIIQWVLQLRTSSGVIPPFVARDNDQVVGTGGADGIDE